MFKKGDRARYLGVSGRNSEFFIVGETYEVLFNDKSSLPLVIKCRRGCKWMPTRDFERVEMTKEQEAYQVLQAASGIEVGDKVKILRTAKDYEMGWRSCWVGSMNSHVGEVGEVVGIVTEGLVLEFPCNRCYAPFFVLEVVEKASKKIEVKYFCDGEDVTNKISTETKRELNK